MLKESRPEYKVWLDGKIVAPEDAKISIFTETAMRGANVYEGIRGYRSAQRENFFIWHIDTHPRRLSQSMKVMRMTPAYSEAELK